MSISVQTLSDKIRETIGTPFHHAGRVCGENGGLDCGGVIIWALRELGFDAYDKPFYNRADGLKDMEDVLSVNNFFQKENIAKPGDIILIRSTDIYHHLVYLTEDETIIHSWITTGVNKVVESVMLPEWWNQIHSVWRWKELED